MKWPCSGARRTPPIWIPTSLPSSSLAATRTRATMLLLLLLPWRRLLGISTATTTTETMATKDAPEEERGRRRAASSALLLLRAMARRPCRWIRTILGCSHDEYDENEGRSPRASASRRTGRMRPWRAIVAAAAAHRHHQCHRQQQSLQARG